MTAPARKWLTFGLAAATLRQVLVLRSVISARRFLSERRHDSPSVPVGDAVVYVVLPVLREATLLDATVSHFEGMLPDPGRRLIVVTTAREEAERRQHARAGDTLAMAAHLAHKDRCVHLHYPDPAGLKADQLNFAAQYLAGQPAVVARRDFMLCYDADSRPANTSLDDFVAVIAAHPDVDVFHQSSRFELRSPGQPNGSQTLPKLVGRAVVDAGALRANRFVLAYELPRLLNRCRPRGLHREASALVYTHVTGHGLCVRLSLLHCLPLPSRSPLEDMHFSFRLNSHGIAMRPIPSLDVAEVPESLVAQHEQASRWFAGPARFMRYRRDPHAAAGWRTEVLALSAAAISVEWLSCAIIPTLLPLLIAHGSTAARRLTATLTALYMAQLVLTDCTMNPTSTAQERVRRLAAFPVSNTVFGVGGWLGAARLWTGRWKAAKTERSSS